MTIRFQTLEDRQHHPVEIVSDSTGTNETQKKRLREEASYMHAIKYVLIKFNFLPSIL